MKGGWGGFFLSKSRCTLVTNENKGSPKTKNRLSFLTGGSAVLRQTQVVFAKRKRLVSLPQQPCLARRPRIAVDVGWQIGLLLAVLQDQ